MKILCLIFILFSFISCLDREERQKKTPFDHIGEKKVRRILKRAIAQAGGWERWDRLKSIHYKKRSLLLLEGGAVESDLTQSHDYIMTPEFSASILWVKDSVDYEINYSKSSAKRWVDQINDDSNPSDIRESVMSALYVLGMPFKLLDEGVELTYQGTTKFMDSVEADIIHATYNPKTYNSHTTDDRWWFYFDSKTGYFLGSKVFHPPTYALIHNMKFTDKINLKFPERRKSYRTDSLGNIKFLRAEFWYSHFEIY